MSASVHVPEEQAGFFIGLLGSLRDVLGERAAAALVQYAAGEAAAREAKNGAARDSGSFAVQLDRLGGLLGSRLRVLEQSGDRVVVAASPPSGPADAHVARAMLSGAVKGTYLARAQSLVASVSAEEEADGTFRITIERSGNAAE